MDIEMIGASSLAQADRNQKSLAGIEKKAGITALLVLIVALYIVVSRNITPLTDLLPVLDQTSTFNNVLGKVSRVLEMILIPLTVTMVYLLLYRKIIRPYLNRHKYPTYHIKAYDDAIVLHGSFALDDYEYIASHILAMRDGYAMTDLVPDEYDGYIAALPKNNVLSNIDSEEKFVTRLLARQGKVLSD